jgi:hypothetical protein
MSNTAHQATAQASPTSNVINVVDAKTKYQFMMAASEAGLADNTYRVAMLLALHFNNTTQRCDPGYKLLMHKLGISKSTLYRALDVLEELGWIVRKHCGPNEVEFTLYIPISTGVTQMTPVIEPLQVSNSGATRVKNGHQRCHHADTTDNSITGKQGSAAPPRAARPADRPVSAPVVADVEMSAFRALCSHYTNIDPSTATEAQSIFNQLVRAGHDVEDLIEASYDHADTCRNSTNQAVLLRAWLTKVQGGSRQ